MQIWVIWLIIVGVLLIIEVLTQMMWALCLAVGCIFGCIASACGLDIVWQIVITSVASLAAYIFLVPLFQKWHALSVDRKGVHSRTGMDALLGRRGVLSETITPERPGRLRIDGDNWQAVSSDSDVTIPRGTEVVVTGYDSIILNVKPVNPIN